MVLKKYKNIEEANQDVEYSADLEKIKKFFEFWEELEKIIPKRKRKAGLFKFRNIEEKENFE